MTSHENRWNRRDFLQNAGLAATLVGTQNRVVLSLRKGRSLPSDLGTRWDWATAGVRRLTEQPRVDVEIAARGERARVARNTQSHLHAGAPDCR